MSCLFNSLGQLLSIPTNNVRQIICDYLAENKPIIDGISTTDILNMESPSYITKMRSSSTWGGAIEIQAACCIWECRILVDNRRANISTSSNIEFLPITGEIKKTLKIYWTGGHYEPIEID